MNYHLAIDIGASSGRHILGHVEDGKIKLEEIHRFDNAQIRKDGHDCWDLPALVRNILAGLKACKDAGKVPLTVGIDTWGVDFVLMDDRGLPCSDAVAYRDHRTDGMPEYVDTIIPFPELYARTGIQRVIFNSLYQLVALNREHPEQLAKADRLLTMPDYLHYVLTGVMANEYTECSTSSLVSARTKTWDLELIAKLGLPTKPFKEISVPGTKLGGFTSAVRDAVGFDAQVILPASHDTGSAYLAVPARDDRAVYLSSGTWSIIGVENGEAITTPEACEANFSNEGGAWYRFRFLKNIMGLWIIQSIRRQLNGVDYVAGKEKTGEGPEVLSDWTPHKYSFDELEKAARAAADFPNEVNAADGRFFSPDSMIGAVRAACREAGQRVPETVGEIVQCAYRSLAASYAREAKALASITGKTYTSLNIVGGGSQDGYLNELTARATGLEVFAGPTEGTAIGNLIVQMIVSGEFADLAAARAAVQ